MIMMQNKTTHQPPPRPITTRMAEALTVVAQDSQNPVRVADDRTVKLLVRRDLVELRDDGYHVTQLGRETLGAKLSTPLAFSTIKACRYWQSFYGLRIELQYQDQDDANWTRLEYPIKLSASETIKFIVRDLERRHLKLDCCPVLVKSPDHSG